MIGMDKYGAHLYSVWDNKTDKLVALDKTAPECATAMGRKIGTFYQAHWRCKHGLEKRWHVERSGWRSGHEREGVTQV